MSTIPSILLRAIPGALIADSGISKLGMDAESSKGLQDFAATGIPQVKELPSDKFGTIIGASEVAVGGALLAPFVSNRLAGLALTTFGAGLLSIYFRNDDMTREDGIRPSQDGMSIAKDSTMVAIGTGLIALDQQDRISGVLQERKIAKAEKKAAKKAARKAKKDARKNS